MTTNNEQSIELPAENHAESVSMRRIISHPLVIVATLIMLLSLVPIIMVNCYARPCADDLAYSYTMYHLVRDGKATPLSLLIEAVKVDLYFYQHWQGLYTSAFLLAFQPGIFGEQYYFIGALVLLVVEYLCSWYFFATVSKYLNLARWCAPFYALVLVVNFTQGMPSMVEGLIWFNGAWNYSPFFFVCLVNVALIVRYFMAEEGGGTTYVILSSVLSFILSGGNHVTGFLNIMLLAILSVYGVTHHKGGVAISLAVALLGYAIMFMAPGTSVRQGNFTRQTPVHTIVESIKRLLQDINNRVNSRLLTFLLMITPLATQIIERCHIKDRLFKIPPLVMPFIVCVVLVGELCVPFYAMGSFGADRLVNICWLTFEVGTAFCYLYALCWLDYRVDLSDTARRLENKVGWTLVTVLVSCAFCVVHHANCLMALTDLRSGEAEAFAAQSDARFEAVKKLKKGDSITFEPLIRTRSLFLGDVGGGIDWGNYYEVKVTVVEPQEQNAQTE